MPVMPVQRNCLVHVLLKAMVLVLQSGGTFGNGAQKGVDR